MVRSFNHGCALPRRQMRALLYRLAVAPFPLARAELCGLFWPDVPPASARRNLTVLLSHLRRTRELPDIVQAQNDQLGLNPALIQVDTRVFAAAQAAALQSGDALHLARALPLYRGPLLQGFALNSVAFERWLEAERQRWARRYLAAATQVIEAHVRLEQLPQALAVAASALAVDPLAEELQRWAMRLAARTAAD